MRARLLLDRRTIVTPSAFVEMVIWKVPQPLAGGTHHYKYRLALVAENVCVLRYDSEAGKGDHIHRGKLESRCRYRDVDRLVADFLADVRKWLRENSDA